MPEPLRHPVILFDGLCNLCEGVVKFVIDRDPRAHFRFASLQSEAGLRLLREHALSTEDWDTFVLIDGPDHYQRSDVGLRIARELTGPWSGLVILYAIPRRVRDWLYGWIVANRYRVFGRKDACIVPTEEIRGRFLS